MTVELSGPGVDEQDEAVAVLREWQVEGTPVQLHPGDLGWFRRFGAEATAAALRTWRREGQVLAVGLLDGQDLLRLGLAPDAQHDEELAHALVADVADPARGVLPPGEAYVEAPPGSLVHDLLGEAGWPLDEPWTPLRRDLTEPVEEPGLRIEVTGPERAHVWAAVHREAFDRSPLTQEQVHRHWSEMATGAAYADARSLVAHDHEGHVVSSVTVWSAGPGRYGVVEPLGVHRDHRGHGHGRSVTLAAAAALRELGSSSALVITPSNNLGAVATYASAGFDVLPERRDRRRDAATA